MPTARSVTQTLTSCHSHWGISQSSRQGVDCTGLFALWGSKWFSLAGINIYFPPPFLVSTPSANNTTWFNGHLVRHWEIPCSIAFKKTLTIFWGYRWLLSIDSARFTSYPIFSDLVVFRNGRMVYRKPIYQTWGVGRSHAQWDCQAVPTVFTLS